MANTKKIFLDWAETGKTVYCVIRREVDIYLLNDADGAFASSPADPYVSLTENSTIKGRYELSESRTVWNDGEYSAAIYKQAGGSPVPASDTIIGSGQMFIFSDAEVVADDAKLNRILGLTLENHVEDDITRDSAGLKTASKIYVYNSKANAQTHDKATGLIATYSVAASYTSNRMTKFTVVKD